MSARDIYNLRRHCKNRGIDLVDNRNGTISINGLAFVTSSDAEDYLKTIPRIDI